jgi:hypothetical protein
MKHFISYGVKSEYDINCKISFKNISTFEKKYES